MGHYEGYDIQAKIDGSIYAAMQKMPAAERQHQVEQMEQTLLANRFQLKAHWETRTLPVYALQVASGKSKLILATSDGPALMPVLFNGHETSVTATGISMDQFIHSPLWHPITDRILVDQTGLTGKYDFNLKWTSDSPSADASDAVSSTPSLFTALQEQLGLRLVPTKAPIEVLVIDHIDRPSEN